VPKVRNLGFVLNRNLTPVDHYKAVCQRLYSVLRSVKPHARYTPFGVRIKPLYWPFLFYEDIFFLSINVQKSFKFVEGCVVAIKL
jgi:hypothetical protein